MCEMFQEKKLFFINSKLEKKALYTNKIMRSKYVIVTKTLTPVTDARLAPVDEPPWKPRCYVHTTDDAIANMKHIAQYEAYHMSTKSTRNPPLPLIQGIFEYDEGHGEEEGFYVRTMDVSESRIQVGVIHAIETGWIWSCIRYVPQPLMDIWYFPVDTFVYEQWSYPGMPRSMDLPNHNDDNPISPRGHRTHIGSNCKKVAMTVSRAELCAGLREAFKTRCQNPDISKLP